MHNLLLIYKIFNKVELKVGSYLQYISGFTSVPALPAAGCRFFFFFSVSFCGVLPFAF